MSTVSEPTRTEERWLECKLDKGMFSDEMAVTYPADGEMQKSVFVVSTEVRRTAEHRGQVRVRLVRRNGDMLAVLPSANQDIVYVDPQDIASE